LFWVDLSCALPSPPVARPRADSRRPFDDGGPLSKRKGPVFFPNRVHLLPTQEKRMSRGTVSNWGLPFFETLSRSAALLNARTWRLPAPPEKSVVPAFPLLPIPFLPSHPSPLYLPLLLSHPLVGVSVAVLPGPRGVDAWSGGLGRKNMWRSSPSGLSRAPSLCLSSVRSMADKPPGLG